MNSFDASIVIPAFNEDFAIQKTLELIKLTSSINLEVLIIVDDENDSTIAAVSNYSLKNETVRVLVQNYGKGPANAIRFGMDNAKAECIVVMMADGSDDARVIPDLVNLINRGVVVSCASRYMSGGQQVGGPRLKKLMSKTAGIILYFAAGKIIIKVRLRN